MDTSEDVVNRARARGFPAVQATWPDFECDAVDAIAFTRSLHHIAPLAAAIRKARRRLTQRGVLLVEDFSLDAIDEVTIHWFRETLRTPAASEFIQSIRGELVTDLLAAADAVLTWRSGHEHDLHTEAAMAQAIAAEFTIRESYAVPYLYRYLVPVLQETPQAAAFLQGVFEQEAKLGAAGDIVLIGRRLVASTLSTS